MILCANPKAQYLASKHNIDAAVARVLGSGWYVLGEEVKQFEIEFASYVGVEHGVGVANGTDAITLSLRACGIGPGDEVITVSHTAVATVAGIEATGARAVLIDIDPHSFGLDPGQLASALSSKTRAIVPVHLYGHPVDMAAVMDVAREHGLRVIEDCAQAHGACYQGERVGSIGDIGCFSFYPTKNLGAIGDGGMAVTDDAQLAQRIRLLREYGWAERYVSHETGYNSRLDELQAAILRAKLSNLDHDNTARRRIAGMYTGALSAAGGAIPHVRQGCDHVFHLFVVRSPQRDRDIERLRDRGVAAGIHYAVPVHLQPAYKGRVRVAGELKHTERVAREVLSLPMYPELTPVEIDIVIRETVSCLTPWEPADLE